MSRTKSKKPKKKKTKHIKGVRYISKALKKYYPKKYKNSKAALPEARTILKKLQKAEQKVILKHIFDIVRKKRTKKEKEIPTRTPVLPSFLTEPQNYFLLSDYPVNIENSPKEVLFRSKQIFPSGTEPIRGGQLVDYTELFGAFVNY
jgi:hypothetical protein